jgi:hypothetical protein
VYQTLTHSSLGPCACDGSPDSIREKVPALKRLQCWTTLRSEHHPRSPLIVVYEANAKPLDQRRARDAIIMEQDMVWRVVVVPGQNAEKAS